ncbi:MULTISPECIES: glycine betaine ABC transporter substrate-binding protein [unclassified Halomonas]|uniref:glycine betaine ABC transporter substrate-binding protein n=1 Tax=unclassified Halomonas TaxID=2609666 RepID=UPI00048025B9|nr:MULTISPECIES: glycine betaine ABC transporter substrate-binding protein [unclassified Halomonas]NAO96033.1 glycine/betaine ABC transporter [Halomonas sp. MG34]PKH60263.1 glycine/betaine ABC transporter [Halomonas sp. Choline-3u-9]QGQ69395.1 glycine betaine ABC transporter substrate-binding protein [Halomonas sp. PA16-9]
MKPLTPLFIACGLAGLSITASANDTLTIGTNNWAENIAVSHMWQQLLEEQGYDVELTTTGKSVLFSGLANGDLDISLEVWLPHGDAQYIEPYKDRVDVHDAWFDGAQDELVVPAYMEDINSISDLKDNAGRFDYQGEPTILGIESGSAISGETENAIKSYNLPFRQLNSSGPAMLAALEEAYANEAPIAVTLWQPHWAYAQYDLKALEDPKKSYGGGDDIMWMSPKGFGEEHPEVTQMLDTWHMSHDQLADLMLTIENLGDPTQGAKQWIEEHRDLIDGWLAEG